MDRNIYYTEWFVIITLQVANIITEAMTSTLLNMLPLFVAAKKDTNSFHIRQD